MSIFTKPRNPNPDPHPNPNPSLAAFHRNAAHPMAQIVASRVTCSRDPGHGAKATLRLAGGGVGAPGRGEA